jgi:hypothetical protein
LAYAAIKKTGMPLSQKKVMILPPPRFPRPRNDAKLPQSAAPLDQVSCLRG